MLSGYVYDYDGKEFQFVSQFPNFSPSEMWCYMTVVEDFRCFNQWIGCRYKGNFRGILCFFTEI
jgi:hypothetical protein